jgi:hypothetical protein
MHAILLCDTLQEGHVTAAATLWRRHAVLLTGDDADCSKENSTSYNSEQDVRIVAALPEALRCLPTTASVTALAAWLRTEVYNT